MNHEPSNTADKRRATERNAKATGRGPRTAGRRSRIDPEKKLLELLNSKNEKIRLEALKLWLPYAYGRPTESSSLNAGIRIDFGNLPIARELAQALAGKVDQPDDQAAGIS